jgi:protein-S-isoprenylcysteine O-methyltransferase Ste14
VRAFGGISILNMKRRVTSRPTPVMSAIAAVVGVLILIFGIVFFSQAKDMPGPIVAFLVVWVLAAIGGIIYHLLNATQPGGVPTQIIESESGGAASGSTAERLQELEDLRSRKLISDAEYETKRQKILNEL